MTSQLASKSSTSRHILLYALLFISRASAFARLPEDVHSVPLFMKPSVSTGQLEINELGLAVLRAQTEPFAIVSAVGPTRTGKSATLGRAFFRGAKENLFAVGSGVKSFTTGAWITSQPVQVETASGKMRVLFIDTEGFSGVGGLTSKTYEANLFGIIYMLSSAVIFNTMYPVDASTVANLNAHSAHALQILQVLKEGGHELRRQKPPLIWSVQSFNLFNLRNDGMEAADLLTALRSSSRNTKEANAHTLTSVLGDHIATSWLVEHLFTDQQLIPLRRPHTSDEVVANLAHYNSTRLSQEYLEDLDNLKRAVTSHLQLVHHCDNTPDQPCNPSPWRGDELVKTLQLWLKNGFIIDDDDKEKDEADETETLFKLGERNRNWLDAQCEDLKLQLRTKFYWHRETTQSNVELRLDALQEVEKMLKGLQSAALSRMVESGVFWKYPGKGATLVEDQSQKAMQRCKDSIAETFRYMEQYLEQRGKLQAETREEQRTQPLKPLQNERGLIYELVAADSTCSASSHDNRLYVGMFDDVEACAEAVSNNCQCGRGFEYHKGNDGYCGCGVAGSANSDCTENTDDFSFGNNRYLLYNAVCMEHVGDRPLPESPEPQETQEVLPLGGKIKKSRQICFEVYD